MKSYLCPNGTLFDQSILQCNYWYNVDCETSFSDYDANMALALSYRRINAAHLPLLGATNVNTLSLLSQNVVGSTTNLKATNRMGKAYDDSDKVYKNQTLTNNSESSKSDNKRESQTKEGVSSSSKFSNSNSLNNLDSDSKSVQYLEFMKLVLEIQKKYRHLKYPNYSD